MRPLWKDILIALWLGMLLPGIVLNASVLIERNSQSQELPMVQTDPETNSGHTIVLQDPDGTRRTMELDAYLTGVLLAEMPAAFHEEALKAQSVAARTYCRKASATGGKHHNGSVCTDSVCCQAYMTEEDFLLRGGTREDLDKIRQAVRATTGMVLVYEGALIEATYFSSTGGSTEAAAEVWGTDFPYLQAVSSPEEVRIHEVVYTLQEFRKLLGITLSGNSEGWFGPVCLTEGGGVATMEIGGKVYSGTQLRAILGLKSTIFRINLEGETIRITTRGYGHRVGMSQYGANAMAETGSTWQQILQHYYPGTNIVPLD